MQRVDQPQRQRPAKRGNRRPRPVLPAAAGTLVAALRRLGVAEGDAVMVHASLRRLGPVVGGARGLIEALIEAVGDPGHIVMPAYSRDALMPELPNGLSTEDYAHYEEAVPGFDPTFSSCFHLGALAETFRCWPGVVRSRHPIHSMTALGPSARRIVAHHARDWAFGLDGPMGRLAERGSAKVLLIGVGWEHCSALHTAETIARYRRLRVLRYKDTTREAPRWVHARDVAEDRENLFPDIGRVLDGHPAMRQGPVGGTEGRLMPLDDILTTAAPLIARAIDSGGANPSGDISSDRERPQRPPRAPSPAPRRRARR
ncbi:MAG: AAC(3) family N-acetyltransferase [Pseudomonadota bacterium]